MTTRSKVFRRCALFLSAAVSAAAQSRSPDVTLRYTPLFDSVCGEATKQPVEPQAVKELRDRMESIRALWRQEGPQLLGAVPEITGVPFRFHEVSATLILCSSFPNGMSAPLLINNADLPDRDIEGEARRPRRFCQRSLSRTAPSVCWGLHWRAAPYHSDHGEA